MSLSFPKNLYHMDLDVGGFDRAIWRMNGVEGITSKPYPTPIQLEKLMGVQKQQSTIRFPKKILGIKEVWQAIVIDYVAAVNNPDISTIVIDSGTQLWSICHRARLQELQEIQANKGGARFNENDFREKLQPIEYGEPNDRMRTLIYTARSYGKNLVITHYPKDVYAQRAGDRGIEEYKTGALDLEGFKETERLVDIVIWVETIKGEARASITKCGLEGLGTKAEGLAIEPSYQGILDLREAMKE